MERRRSLLVEFDKSGLSGAKFAELSGIKYSTFAYWLQKRRDRRCARGAGSEPVDANKQMRWLEAVIEEAKSPAGSDASALVLQLPGGARMQLSQLGQVGLAAALLVALEKPAVAC